MAHVSALVEDGAKLLDDSFQVWTLLQDDPNLLRVKEVLQQKQEELEMVKSAIKTRPVSHKLEKISESNSLQ